MTESTVSRILRASVSRAAVLRRSERTCCSSASADEVGGFPMFAPPICRRRWRNNAFPFCQLRRRRRQPSEHRSERSELSNTARCASRKAKKIGLE
jgi:hypothetical protein